MRMPAGDFMKIGDGVTNPSDRGLCLCMKYAHLTELFRQFATAQMERLIMDDGHLRLPVDERLKQLLGRFHSNSDVITLQNALLDPYFPLGMLVRTIFSAKMPPGSIAPISES